MRAAAKAPGVDSRQYRFAYLLRGPSDWSADFPVRESDLNWDLGLFLPATDNSWSGATTSSPWILLLCKDRLVCQPHPSASLPQIEFQLSAIVEMETGHLLLDCWFGVHTQDAAQQWRYFARDEERVSDFMRRVRARMALRCTVFRLGEFDRWGGPLEPKFSFALSEELLDREMPLLTFRNVPVVRREVWGVFSRNDRTAGDLVSISSRQLIWITERLRDRVQEYGTIRRIVPLHVWQDIALRRNEGIAQLEISLGGEFCWRIPIESANLEAARSFVREASSLLGAVRGRSSPE